MGMPLPPPGPRDFSVIGPAVLVDRQIAAGVTENSQNWVALAGK